MASRTSMIGASLACVALGVACAASEAAPPVVTPPTTVAVAPTQRVAPPPPSHPEPTPLAPATVAAAAARPPDPPPPSAHATPGVPVPAWDDRWPAGWTDPRVVARLADRCDFVPLPPEKDPGLPGTDGDVFACTLTFEQACITDDCYEETGICRHDCESRCTSCSAACTTACEPCEAACTDAACKRACATKTAACKQSCTRTMDRCDTAGCGKASKDCEVAIEHAWKANHCAERCAVYGPCFAACQPSSTHTDEAATRACVARCDQTMAPGHEECRGRCATALKAGASPAENARCLRRCDETAPCSPSACLSGP